jgi:SynChlorMet cassette radical SAM/SPASM protein ScmF
MNTSDNDEMNRRLPPLSAIYFYLTEGCNLACRHCWIGPKFSAEGSDAGALSIDLFKTAIHEAKQLGLRGVKFTGGEPLLHPDIKALLEIIRQEELGLSIETNGVLCTPEIAKVLAKTRIRQIAVSLDGVDAQTHDWMRGVPGSFAKTISGVTNLVNQGIRPQIIMTLMRRNRDQIDQMVHMAEQLHAKSLKFNIMQPTARGAGFFDSGESLNIDELIAIGKKVEDKSPATPIKLIYSVPMAFRSLGNIAKMSYYGGCNIHNIIGVLATGHYALCGIGSNEPDLVFGKIGEQPLKDIWSRNKILNELRSGLPEKLSGICKTCVMKANCRGYCRAHSYYRTGNLWSPDLFCELAEKALLFPRTRIA